MLEWLWKSSSIVARAKELWQTAIALTDYNWVYGLHDFYFTALKHKIKGILWLEIRYLPYYQLLARTKDVSEHDFPHITLLALSSTWYHNLLKITSLAYEIDLKDAPLLTNEILMQHSEGLAVLVWWLKSYAYYLVNNDPTLWILEDHIEQMAEIFTAKNVYIDITAQLYSDYPWLKKLTPELLALWENKYKILTSSPYFYPYKDQKGAYETALAIKDNKRTYQADSRKINWSHHIFSEEEVRTILEKNKYMTDQISTRIQETELLSQRIDASIQTGQELFPNYKSSSRVEELYKKHKDSLIE